MKHYQLTIVSKNKKSVENCFLFFSKSIRYDVIKKYFRKKKKKNVLTILKSPHVNKNAQEQFESKLFANQVSIYTSKSYLFLVFLKKIKIYLFPDVKIKIKFILNKNLTERTQTNIFNPSNFRLDAFEVIKSEEYTQKNRRKTKTSRYETNKEDFLKNAVHFLKIFDMYSELRKF
jgi:ribosomal protein S10